MVRDADHTLSSIALLQERFRQLQRMKELRQERELMRLKLSDSERCTTTRRFADFAGGARPSPPPPAPPHCQLALSLWPDSQPERAESNTVKSCKSIPAPFNLYETNSHSEIDTSLRL